MSVAAQKQRLNAEEFRQFVQQPVNRGRWFELVRGEVIEMPPPTKPHGWVANNLGRMLGNYSFQVERFEVYGNDTGVILARDPDTVRGPDVSVYDDDIKEFSEIHPKYGETAPLLAVEVLSASDRIGRTIRKVQDYLEGGVLLVWLVDPEDQNVTVYRAGKPPVVLGQSETLTGEDVLPGFQCLVSEVFRLPKQKSIVPEGESTSGEPA